jgi:hypothetical protein
MKPRQVISKTQKGFARLRSPAISRLKPSGEMPGSPFMARTVPLTFSGDPELSEEELLNQIGFWCVAAQ